MALSKEQISRVKDLLRLDEPEGKIKDKLRIVTSDDINEIRIEMSPATPETKARMKNKKDPLLYLSAKGFIGDNELLAADHIRAAYQIITAGITPKTNRYEPRVDYIGGKPSEGETLWAVRIQEQYNDWHKECTARQIMTGPILHVLTEAVTLTECDRFYGKKEKFTRAFMVSGLKLYVEMFRPRGRNK